MALATFVLTFDYKPRGQVRDADGRVCFLHVLAAGAGSAVYVNAQILRIDLDGFYFVGFGHDGNRTGRSVHAALSFCFRHALHAVAAGLEFQSAVCTFTDDSADDFTVAAEIRVALADDFHAPTAAFRVAHVHAQQVARKQCRLFASRAGTDFKESVLIVVRVARQKQNLQVLFEFFELFLAGEHFFAGKFGDFGILGHFFGRSDVLERLFVFLGLENNRFDFGAFARKFREALHVVCCIRCCEHGIEFFKTTAKTEKLGADVFFHCHTTENGSLLR